MNRSSDAVLRLPRKFAARLLRILVRTADIMCLDQITASKQTLPVSGLKGACWRRGIMKFLYCVVAASSHGATLPLLGLFGSDPVTEAPAFKPEMLPSFLSDRYIGSSSSAGDAIRPEEHLRTMYADSPPGKAGARHGPRQAEDPLGPQSQAAEYVTKQNTRLVNPNLTPSLRTLGEPAAPLAEDVGSGKLLTSIPIMGPLMGPLIEKTGIEELILGA